MAEQLYGLTKERRDELLRLLDWWQNVRGSGIRNTPWGMSQSLPRPPRRRPQPPDEKSVLVKITDPESGGGKYAGYILRPPTTVASESGDLSEDEIGTTTDATNCLILNTEEVGEATHDLATSSYLPVIFLGRIIGATTDGKPVVVIGGSQWKNCS